MEDKEVQPLIERMDYLVNRVSIDFHRYLFGKIKWKNRRFLFFDRISMRSTPVLCYCLFLTTDY